MLTLKQAAEKLAIKPDTVKGFIKSGALQGAKIGKCYRIEQSDLDSFIQAEKQKFAKKER